MESGIDASVVSLSMNKKNEVKKRDEEIFEETLLNCQPKNETKTKTRNPIRGFLLAILSAFLFCMNSTFSKMAFTLSAADNTFVSNLLHYLIRIATKILDI